MPIRSSEKKHTRGGGGGWTRPQLMFSSADEEPCTDPKGRRTERESANEGGSRWKGGREEGKRGVPVLRCNVAPLLSRWFMRSRIIIILLLQIRGIGARGRGVRGVCVSDNQVEQMKFRRRPRLEEEGVCEHYAWSPCKRTLANEVITPCVALPILRTGGSLLNGFSSDDSTGAFKSRSHWRSGGNWTAPLFSGRGGLQIIRGGFSCTLKSRRSLCCSCGGAAVCIHVSVAHYLDLINLITAEHAQREKRSQRLETDNLVRRRLHVDILLSVSTPPPIAIIHAFNVLSSHPNLGELKRC